MFIGSIIALSLSLSLLGFLIVLIIVQRVRAHKAAAELASSTTTPPRHSGTAGHVIASNFVAAGATPPTNAPSRPNIVGKPVL